MALVYDTKYPLYYSIPDGTQVGVIKFYFDAPILVGDLVSAIVDNLVPVAIGSQGGQVTRVKVWVDQLSTLVNRWTTEFSIYFPQAAGLAGTRLFAFVPALAAIWAFIVAHGSEILALIGISMVINFLTTMFYGPVNPNTGEREQPFSSTMIVMAVIIAVAAVVVGGLYYYIKQAKQVTK